MPGDLRGAHWILGLALVLHGILCWGWISNYPALEGPDERAHREYAQRLADGAGLPLILSGAAKLGRPAYDESPLGHHPPLYYALLAAIERIGFPDGARVSVQPSEIRGAVPARGSMLWQHGFDELRPSREQARLKILRGSSVLLGLMTLLATFRLARLALPGRPRVAGWSTLFLATLPAWSFTHAVLDNGNLAAAASSVALALLAGALARERVTLAAALGIAALTAIGLLSKLTSLCILPALFLVACWFASGGPNKRKSAAHLFLALALALAALLPWVLRNLELYGEPLGSKTHAVGYAASALPAGLRGAYLLKILPAETLKSWIAGLGSSWIELPVWVPALWAGVAILGLIGFASRSKWPMPQRQALLLTLLVVGNLAIYLYFNWTFRQPQGRYLFAALPPVAVALGSGIDRIGSRLGRPGSRLLPACGITLALGTLWIQQRLAIPAWRIAADPNRTLYASLTSGMKTPTPAAQASIELLGPADDARMDATTTILWRVLDPDPTPLSLHLWIDRSPLVIGSYEHLGPKGALDAQSGRFSLPTTLLAQLPRGARVHWKLRRLVDRSVRPSAAPSESETRTLRVP